MKKKEVPRQLHQYQFKPTPLNQMRKMAGQPTYKGSKPK